MMADIATDSCERWRRIVRTYKRFATPAEDGLPRARVLLAFPLALLILGAVLVGLGLNGSSSGAFYPEISAGKDPALLAGEPERTRSDEWNVGMVWTIAQVEQGLPEKNRTFPGGMDADLPYDLPNTGPSMVFKPHLWGFLVLDVGRAVAWRWWLPGLALIVAAYLFLVTMLPRRPVLSAALATALFASPFVQWWYQTTTLWPMAWGLLTMAAILWGIRARRPLARWLWALPVAYVTVVMAMGVYAPFIVPVAYVVIFAAAGVIVQALRDGMRLRELFGRAMPVIVGGTAGIGATLLWLQLKADTVNGFLSTVYPGERLSSTGGGRAISAAQLFASSFSQALTGEHGFLGLNSSEASTFFFVGVVLIPVVVWIVISRRRSRLPLPWLAIAMTAVVVLFAAWIFVPGWDWLSHLLALDRTMAGRVRIGLGVASFALVACVIRESEGRMPGRWLAGILGVGFLASQAAIAVAVTIVLGPERVWGDAPLWWLVALATAASIFFFARGRVMIGAFLLFVVSVTSTIGVHPVYSGVLDLRETPVAQAVMHIDEESDEPWVGVGGSFIIAVLLESGAEAYNGTQGAPSREMWDQIDPDGRYESAWNRIGAVRWTPGEGEPAVTNPVPDVILSTFDACSGFAQRHVGRVLADTDLVSPCLVATDRFPMPHYTITLYDVVPRS
jgi:hypothetical protein